MSASAAFDAIASRYDELWTATPVGRAQRDQVWRTIDPLFHAGDAVLDIGCGTGEDAAHMAARGVTVHAIDASPEMVLQAARRRGFTTDVRAAEQITEMSGGYDGALSNFGVLNCIADLDAVARGLGCAVRPGGRLALCVIGRFCWWETAWHAVRLQFGTALRRVRHRVAASSLGVRVHYRAVREIREAFAPEFQCDRWMGVGLLVPPSYVRLPRRLVRVLGALDRVLAGLPVLRGLADHRLIILVRK